MNTIRVFIIFFLFIFSVIRDYVIRDYVIRDYVIRDYVIRVYVFIIRFVGCQGAIAVVIRIRHVLQVLDFCMNLVHFIVNEFQSGLVAG